jgi:hypothetical protein
LGVWSNSTPINSKILLTKQTGPQCTGVKIQTFQLTSNDPTSIIENAISLELGLYSSNHHREHYRCTIAATVTSRVLQHSPFKKSHPEITEEEGSSENKERLLNHCFGHNNRKVGLIGFVIPVQDCAFYR